MDTTVQNYPEIPLPQINPIASMIIESESRYLYWLTHAYYEGSGAIVDAGCLLGGSTHALASGLTDNARIGNKHGRIHSYDLFLYEPFSMKGIMGGETLEPGESLLPIFQRNTARFSELIEVHLGDFCGESWRGGPIEIFFIDLAKSWGLCRHAIREFFPSLIPGRSIIVHQDYFDYYCYWIHITMELMADYIEPLHQPGGGIKSFICRKAVPEELLNRDFEQTLDADEQLDLLDRARERVTGTNRWVVAAAKIKLLAALHRYDEAIELGNAIRQASDFQNYLLISLLNAEKHLPPERLLPALPPDAEQLAASRHYDYYRCGERWFARPRAGRPELQSASSLEAMEKAAGESIRPRPGFWPAVVAVDREQRIVVYARKYYLLPVSINVDDVTKTALRNQLPAYASLHDALQAHPGMARV